MEIALGRASYWLRTMDTSKNMATVVKQDSFGDSRAEGKLLEIALGRASYRTYFMCMRVETGTARLNSVYRTSATQYKIWQHVSTSFLFLTAHLAGTRNSRTHLSHSTHRNQTVHPRLYSTSSMYVHRYILYRCLVDFSTCGLSTRGFDPVG